jgi:hypothetical protein
MPAIRLDLTKLPPSGRRQSILVLRKPELIAKFIRRHDWTDTFNSVPPELPTKSLVRIYAYVHPGGEALVAGYGVVLLPNGKTIHRLLIVHCWTSELQQTRVGLEIITASYLEQIAGTEVRANIHLTELADDFDTEPKPQIRKSESASS